MTTVPVLVIVTRKHTPSAYGISGRRTNLGLSVIRSMLALKRDTLFTGNVCHACYSAVSCVWSALFML